MNQKNDSFSIHFTILLANIPESIPEKRPKTVKESELRFFWNRNRHSPSLLYLSLASWGTFFARRKPALRASYHKSGGPNEGPKKL